MICTKLEIQFTDYFQVHKGMISLWMWKNRIFCKANNLSVVSSYWCWTLNWNTYDDDDSIEHKKQTILWLQLSMTMKKIIRIAIYWAWILLWAHSTQSIFISRNFSSLIVITSDKNIATTISKIKEIRFWLAIHRHVVIFIVCSDIDSTEGVESADSELPAASAVCQFSMSDIREAFNGPFIKRMNNAWRPYDPRLEGDNIVPSPYSVSTVSS